MVIDKLKESRLDSAFACVVESWAVKSQHLMLNQSRPCSSNSINVSPKSKELQIHEKKKKTDVTIQKTTFAAKTYLIIKIRKEGIHKTS